MALLRCAAAVIALGCVETTLIDPPDMSGGSGTVTTCREAAHYVVADCGVFNQDRLQPLADACAADPGEPWTFCARIKPTPDCVTLHFCAEALADAGSPVDGGPSVDGGVGDLGAR